MDVKGGGAIREEGARLFVEFKNQLSVENIFVEVALKAVGSGSAAQTGLELDFVFVFVRGTA